MRTMIVAAGVALALAVGAANAAAADPVLQSFDISFLAVSGHVTASGAAVNGRGTVTPTSATTYSMTFPTGPARLTETVLQSTGGLGLDCVERLSTSGTFTFDYFPTAVVGLRFGGDGTYTQTSLTIYRPLAGGGCDTAGPPLLRNATVHAGATHVFAVL